jgi:1-acyl-sn-glycerol-3-phosphate acyltransferase
MPETTPLPKVSPGMLRWFTWYARRYVRKSFHTVRISGEIPATSDRPLIIYLNHASWWDPLICLVVASNLFPSRRHFAPIDAAMLRKYRFFAKLGFFGVEPGTARGARQFLRTASAVCQTPGTALWITAEGRFNDVRSRPVVLRPGLAHLLKRGGKDALVVPLAIEYTFWEERFAEVLCRFGSPVAANASNAVLEDAMTRTQDLLAVDVISRDAARFTTIVGGAAGVGGVYDIWRRIRARATGRTFDSAHGSQPND